VERPSWLRRAAGWATFGGLRERRRQWQRLAEACELSLDLIGTTSFDGYFTHINPAVRTILGYEPEEFMSRRNIELVHPDDRERTIAKQRELRGGVGDTFSFQNRYRTKSGEYRRIEWSARSDPKRRVTSVVGRDVTEQHRAQVVLRRHEQTLMRLLERRARERDGARLETLRRLALAAGYRDDETYRHTERVGQTAQLLAQELGAPLELTAALRQAAPLHDVGKLAISDTILLKPGKLTPQERNTMEAHTIAGGAILRGSDSRILQLAEEIALTHHERWDGTGYPNRLAGEAIPLGGRIVAVADVFDALCHRRPYKPAWDVGAAVAEITRLAGTQFDPTVVDAFLRLNHHQLLHVDVNRPESNTAAA
jgi:PAS domain S-box-containing protein